MLSTFSVLICWEGVEGRWAVTTLQYNTSMKYFSLPLVVAVIAVMLTTENNVTGGKHGATATPPHS